MPLIEAPRCVIVGLRVQNWAASAGVNMSSMSARSAGVFSGMSSSLRSAADSKAFMAGTKDFVGKSTALFSSVRGKFTAARSNGSGGK